MDRDTGRVYNCGGKWPSERVARRRLGKFQLGHIAVFVEEACLALLDDKVRTNCRQC